VTLLLLPDFAPPAAESTKTRIRLMAALK